MIQLYTGDGKGKTTAAIGQCVRGAGSGLCVVFSQFMKGNDTGELAVLTNIPRVTILRSNQNFGFFKSMSDEDKRQLTKIHNDILDEIEKLVASDSVDMIIMDEITYPISFGLISVEKLENLLKLVKAKNQKHPNHLPEVICTGRNPGEMLLTMADYVTEMKKEKHPYDQGIMARKGIEY